MHRRVYRSAMLPTKDEIKAWLKKFNHSREWLGEKCGNLQKRSVDNWLSSPKEIPEGTLALIGRLMEDDERAEAERRQKESQPLSNVVIRVDTDEFEDWCQAGLKHQQTVTDYCLAAIRAGYRAENPDAADSSAAPNVSPIFDFDPDLSSKVAEDPAEYKFTPRIIELPFYGPVAAGQPVSSPLLDETLRVAREYSEKHFIVEINGQSAEPDFMDGDRWIIDGRDCFTPKHGKPCIVSDGYGSYLKKWNRGKQVFESINPAFSDVLPLEEAKLQGYPVEKL